MKKVKIFLASSIHDLRDDRIAFGDFIRSLNDLYLDRGVYFSLVKCEDCDEAIAADGKQSEYDREIAESDLVFFLFFRKAGEYTRHEFDVALDAFRAKGKPKIVTYFKYVETPEEATGEVAAFMQYLDVELRHFYNVYREMDTLKLGLVMQLKILSLDDGEEPRVEDGAVKLCGVTVGETASIPAFANNEAIAKLTAERDRLARECEALKQKFFKTQADEDSDRLLSLTRQRDKTAKQLSDAQNAVLDAVKDMAEKTSSPLSDRQRRAYHALDRGDYAGALEALDLRAIMSDAARAQKKIERSRAELQVNVNELMQRISVLKRSAADENAAKEIDMLYRECVKLSEQYDLDPKPIFDYANYLTERGLKQEALKTLERLLKFYRKHGASPAAEAEAEYLMAFLFGSLSRNQEAEQHAARALELAERADPAKLYLTVKILARLGQINLALRRFSESEDTLLRGLSKIADSSEREAFAGLERELRQDLGTVYLRQGALDRAREAILAPCFRAQPPENSSRRTRAVFFCNCGNAKYLLAGVEQKAQNAESALQYAHEAIDLYRRAKETYPLADLGWNFALAWEKVGGICMLKADYEGARRAFRTELENLEALPEQNAHSEAGLATAHSRYAAALWGLDDRDGAEREYAAADELYEQQRGTFGDDPADAADFVFHCGMYGDFLARARNDRKSAKEVFRTGERLARAYAVQEGPESREKKMEYVALVSRMVTAGVVFARAILLASRYAVEYPEEPESVNFLALTHRKKN